MWRERYSSITSERGAMTNLESVRCCKLDVHPADTTDAHIMFAPFFSVACVRHRVHDGFALKMSPV
jgi:hypothetical protein